MRCEEVRDKVWEAGEGDPGERIGRHIAACADCRSYARNAAKVRAGLRLLSQEEEPEPSWGFASRVLRRLAEVPPGKEATRWFTSPEFLESAGRRVIMATLVLVFTLLLAMILPSSGPVRRQPASVAYWPQAETASAVSYPVDWSSVPAVPALVSVRPVADYESR
ncbi:MAG: anti-sigma factor family protein [Candidatus Acidiferrales bacterium]